MNLKVGAFFSVSIDELMGYKLSEREEEVRYDAVNTLVVIYGAAKRWDKLADFNI